MPGKRIAIVQSSYIPWKGYFDLIRAVDEFILLDDVQYTRRDWRNRNCIKSPAGLVWLTIPVNNKGRYTQLVQDVTVVDRGWAERHWRLMSTNYARTPFFDTYAQSLAALFERCTYQRLSEVNHACITQICRWLDIRTHISWSTDYKARTGRMERLIDLCHATGAVEYLSGPTARQYLDLEQFGSAGIHAQFADYSGYPEYPQPHSPFAHGVTILDLLFCTGPRALEYMKAL